MSELPHCVRQLPPAPLPGGRVKEPQTRTWGVLPSPASSGEEKQASKACFDEIEPQALVSRFQSNTLSEASY